MISGAPAARPAGPGGELSQREVEVLVETHRAHIYPKLNVRTRAQSWSASPGMLACSMQDESPGRHNVAP